MLAVILGPLVTIYVMGSRTNALIRKILSEHQNYFEQRIGQQNEKQTKDFFEFSHRITTEVRSDFEALRGSVQDRLDKMSLKITQELSDSFKQSNKTFQDVISRLAKIDEAQKQIDKLSVNVNTLQNVLTDKKTRGIFGEVQLAQILDSIFGQSKKNYDLQYKLSTGAIVDAILFLPQPINKLAIDSKFPLENYLKMTDKKLEQTQREVSEKEFKKNLKKHIDDIASKYIIANETANQAILFLPAEAIFAEVNAYHQDIIEYAQKAKVWISSPTTLMANLTSIQLLINQFERDKYTHIIQKELEKLSVDFSRYRVRWDKLASHIETVSKDVREIHISTHKISDHFGRITDVDFEENKPEIEGLI